MTITAEEVIIGLIFNAFSDSEVEYIIEVAQSRMKVRNTRPMPYPRQSPEPNPARWAGGMQPMRDPYTSGTEVKLTPLGVVSEPPPEGEYWTDVVEKSKVLEATGFCSECNGLGWIEDVGSNTADGMQTKKCPQCHGQERHW